ncbi:hypothetical protein CC80DRAFT_553662 [Byssothecium circinans]|uniref:Uncharacterized protein n=1 Tax=Byssothecium circinans TaxID=147558 RepID=A0A6A5TE03_9PLEO|nr:hypothetical protein CC80DRAFT_553662 [Byssothecium circinans]
MSFNTPNPDKTPPLTPSTTSSSSSSAGTTRTPSTPPTPLTTPNPKPRLRSLHQPPTPPPQPTTYLEKLAQYVSPPQPKNERLRCLSEDPTPSKKLNKPTAYNPPSPSPPSSQPTAPAPQSDSESEYIYQSLPAATGGDIKKLLSNPPPQKLVRIERNPSNSPRPNPRKMKFMSPGKKAEVLEAAKPLRTTVRGEDKGMGLIGWVLGREEVDTTRHAFVDVGMRERTRGREGVRMRVVELQREKERKGMGVGVGSRVGSLVDGIAEFGFENVVGMITSDDDDI